jgi:hypothetical protein
MHQKNELKPFLLLLVSLLFFLAAPLLSITMAAGQQDKEEAIKGIGSRKRKLFKVPMAKGKIKVDGNLADPAWEDALVLYLDYEREPGENIKAPVKTEVRLLTTTTHIYVAFRAYDPHPEKIRARLTDRDNMWHDDYVGINLDTFNDARHFYGFYSNPYGIQGDQSVALGDYQRQWDAIWGSAAKITKEGYNVEMSIPYNALRFQRTKGEQAWGLDLVRNYPRNVNYTLGLWPRDRDSTCYMCQSDRISGFRGAKPGNNVELNPTVTAVLNQELDSFPDGKMEKKDSSVSPGITARWNFTPNLTLLAAINPDFSHVEADAAQLDINTPYALFYPEKRPFFQENAAIFLTPYYAVYSRAIKDPDWGVKLTGKEGKSTIGFFSVKDSKTTFLFPTAETTTIAVLDRSNLSSAFRYNHDVGKASTIGLIASDREGDDYYNRVIGVDANLRLTKRHYLVFQALGSQTRYPGTVAEEYGQSKDKIQGTGLAIQYMYYSQHVYIYTQYYDASPDFRTDVGFHDRSGYRYADFTAAYRWRRNNHWYTKISLGGMGVYAVDYDGNPLEKSVKANLSYNGPLQSSLSFDLKTGKYGYFGQEFDNTNLTIIGSLRPSGDLYFSMYSVIGDQIDYANAKPATQFLVQPGINYNAGKHLRLELSHIFERLNSRGGGKIYTANLTNARVVYQFNSRAFLRTLLQYADYKYNPDAYSYPLDPRFKHLFSQVLFSYKVNARTVLFLGYSDDYYGYKNIPITQNNRTFFLKVGYALVL